MRRAAAPVLGAAVVGASLVLAGCSLPRPPQDDPVPAATARVLPVPPAPSPPAAGSSPTSPPATPGPAPGEDVAGFDGVERAAVRVRNVECASGIATGSGFAVDDHTLITNRHVVSGARTLQVDTYDGRELSVRATVTSTVADLAVVRTRESLPAHLPLAAADPATGEPVRVVGFPRGGQMTTSSGRVLGMVADPLRSMAEQVLATDVDVAPGSSGSPVLDAGGWVVGVVYAGASDATTSYAIPVSVLTGVLAREGHEAAPTCG